MDDASRGIHERIDEGKLTEAELRQLASSGDDASVRAHAAIVLGDERLLKEAVAMTAGNPTEHGMWYGVQAIRSAWVLHALLPALTDKSLLDLVRTRVAYYASLEELTTWLRDKSDPELRTSIIYHAGTISERFERNADEGRVWNGLLEELALGDEEASVRLAAARRLEAAEPLLRILESSPDPEVRRAAAKEFLPADRLLAVARRDPVPEVRVEALEALSLQGDEPDGLVELADDADGRVAAAAAKALKKRSSVEKVLSSAGANASAVETLKSRPGWRVLVSLPVRYSDPTVHVYVFPPSFSDLGWVLKMEEIGGTNFFTSEGLRRWYLRNEGEPTGMHATIVTEAGAEPEAAEIRWHERGFCCAVFTDVEGDFSKLRPQVTLWAGSLALMNLEQPQGREESADRWGYRSMPEFERQENEALFNYSSGGMRRLVTRLLELRVFAAYSRVDLNVVKLATSFNRALPFVKFEYDLEVLSSGEIWESAVEDKIRRADIFQLFWSPAAAASAAVEKEWRFALSLKRKRFVCPVYWHSAGPNPLPPPELAPLHFQRLEIPSG